MRLFKIIPYIVITLMSINCFSQDAKIIEMINNGNYEEAANVLSTGNSIEDMEIGDLSALGFCYINLKNYTDGERVYQEITSRKDANPINYAYYGEILLINEKYDQAKNAFEVFLEENPENLNAQIKLQSCDSLKAWQNYSTDVSIKPVKSINTQYEEKSSLFFDNKLVFVSNRIPETYRNKTDLSENLVQGYLISNDSLTLFQEDLLDSYTCEAMDYSAASNMLAFTLRKKKKFMVETEFSEADIFFRNLDEKTDSLIEFSWEEKPENISTAHPAFANNGKRLYFTSDMDDGYGGSDLYYSDFKDGKWSKPVNLGKTINTEKHDVFPVVDGDTILYYSSDGMPGYGNLDIFKSRITGNELSQPLNMKAPINSIGNDFSYYKTDKYSGYLTSNRSELSQGLNDILRHKRPEPVIEEPEEEPEEPEKPEEILVFNPENFHLDPVFFDLNKNEIDKTFYEALDQIADTLKFYDDLSLRLTGHADAKGPSSFSNDLAEKRANAVKNYLEDKGVKTNKLTTDNAGITKDRNVDGITYHVQIGTSTKDNATEWYADLIDNSYKIIPFEKGQYTLYTIGQIKSKDKALALKKEIGNNYNIKPLVICSCKGKLLSNCYYALNRRVEFSWIK